MLAVVSPNEQTCSTTNILYSNICRCISGCIWLRNTFNCSGLFRYGIKIATFAIDWQFCGFQNPPNCTAPPFLTASGFPFVAWISIGTCSCKLRGFKGHLGSTECWKVVLLFLVSLLLSLLYFANCLVASPRVPFSGFMLAIPPAFFSDFRVLISITFPAVSGSSIPAFNDAEFPGGFSPACDSVTPFILAPSPTCLASKLIISLLFLCCCCCACLSLEISSLRSRSEISLEFENPACLFSPRISPTTNESNDES